MLGAILAGGVGLLWLIFAFTATSAEGHRANPAGQPSAVTNIGVMPPGGQVNPVDQWVGTAGASWPSTRTSAKSRDGSTRIARPSKRARCSASRTWNSG
jgi:hypothetical protein